MVIILLLYVAGGYTGYLHYLYQQGPPISLSVFSQMDIQLLLLNPGNYNMFILFPLVTGIALIVSRYSSRMQVLLYQSKKNLFKQQIIECSCLSIFIIAAGEGAAWLCGTGWNKVIINWGRANSFFAITNNQLLEVRPEVVMLINITALAVRNLIVTLLILYSWWRFQNILYGIFAVGGICFCEAGSGRIAIILRSIYTDYDFWIEVSEQVKALAAMSVWLLLLITGILSCMKRKEF